MSIYLDYNSTTPLDPQVKEKMVEAMDIFGNPSSIHQNGQVAKEIVESARYSIANYLNVATDSIYFTSGSTEANNLILRELCKKNSHFIWLPLRARLSIHFLYSSESRGTRRIESPSRISTNS